MASELLSEAQAFHRFLTGQLQSDGSDKSPEELLELWRAEQRQGEFDNSVAALQEAIADMEAGDTGRPVREAADEIRKQHGFSPDA